MSAHTVEVDVTHLYLRDMERIMTIAQKWGFAVTDMRVRGFRSNIEFAPLRPVSTADAEKFIEEMEASLRSRPSRKLFARINGEAA